MINQLEKTVPVHREFSSLESAGNLVSLMWEVGKRRLRRLGTVSHWNFPGVRCNTGMSAVVEWRPRNSSFSWISAFQCSHQTSGINATNVSHSKDNLKSIFKNSVFCKLFQFQINITLQCIWYTQEQTRCFIKTYAAKVSWIGQINRHHHLFPHCSLNIQKLVHPFHNFTVWDFGNIQYLIFNGYVCLINLTNYRPLLLDWF